MLIDEPGHELLVPPFPGNKYRLWEQLSYTGHFRRRWVQLGTVNGSIPEWTRWSMSTNVYVAVHRHGTTVTTDASIITPQRPWLCYGLRLNEMRGAWPSGQDVRLTHHGPCVRFLVRSALIRDELVPPHCVAVGIYRRWALASTLRGDCSHTVVLISSAKKHSQASIR